MNVYRSFLFFVVLASGTALVTCSSPRRTSSDGDGDRAGNQDRSKTAVSALAFVNGKWFDGKAFVAGTRYVVGEVLRTTRPASVATTIDLAGGYVVPPYGEGHTHLMEADKIDIYIQQYLDRGIFYAKDQSSALSIRRAIAGKVNRPASLDVVFANAGFTAPGGHPLQVIKQLEQLGALPAAASHDGDAVIVVRDASELASKWDGFLAGKPDFVKVFLLYSEEYDKRKDDPEYEYRRGIDPALVPAIVARAHRAGLSVSAHVYTASDFRSAVAAGVDEIAHLPGIGYDRNLGAEHFRLTDEDARQAGERHARVVTTLTKIAEDAMSSAEVARYFDDVVRGNLDKLRAAGVTILIGADQFRRTSDVEISHLSRMGLFDNLALLRAFSIDTPRAMFPGRRIGSLDDGYEASFLVLQGNPLDEPTNLLRIALRVKQGQIFLVEQRMFPRDGDK